MQSVDIKVFPKSKLRNFHHFYYKVSIFFRQEYKMVNKIVLFLRTCGGFQQISNINLFIDISVSNLKLQIFSKHIFQLFLRYTITEIWKKIPAKINVRLQISELATLRVSIFMAGSLLRRNWFTKRFLRTEQSIIRCLKIVDPLVLNFSFFSFFPLLCNCL